MEETLRKLKGHGKDTERKRTGNKNETGRKKGKRNRKAIGIVIEIVIGIAIGISGNLEVGETHLGSGYRNHRNS